MPKKSAFKGPGVQRFQLVHRSQRDPLIHDAEASKLVFRDVSRGHALGKAGSEAGLETTFASQLSIEEKHVHVRPNVGQASMYEIYYDDTEYDYMQHLRPIGVQEEGVASILLEAAAAPSSSRSKTTKKGKEGEDSGNGIAFKQQGAPTSVMPNEVLPSKQENTLDQTYEASRAIPSSIAGFRPDMDPHLRQTLEALEDGEFVDDGLGDDFFGELIKDGERTKTEDPGFKFYENGEEVEKEEEGGGEGGGESSLEEESWETRFSKFKRQQQQLAAADASKSDVDDDSGDLDGEDDGRSEAQDTVRTLPRLPVIGGKRRRKGASDASGYSLTSSSMYRNEGLTALDERFAEIEKEYESDGEDDLDDEAVIEALIKEKEEEAPDLRIREDFESLMEDFLDRYELVGGKLKIILEGNTAAEKLGTLRTAMIEDDSLRERILRRLEQVEDGEDEEDEAMPLPSIVGIDDDEDRWDVETILSTYSNLENHPKVIGLKKNNHRFPQIKLNKRTGIPMAVVDDVVLKSSSPDVENTDDRKALRYEVLGEEANEPEVEGRKVITTKRPKDETPEERKARRRAVKEERRTRRAEKKLMKQSFAAEHKNQAQVQRVRKIAETVRPL